MKKLSIVLLALLLVGGMAFAAEISLTGEASITAGVDLQDSSFGLSNGTDTGDVDFSLTLASGTGSDSGEGDVYAVIEMSASIDVNVDGTDLDDNGTVAGDDETGDEIVTSVSVDKATIYAGDLSVSILSASAAVDKAAGLDVDGDDDADYNIVDVDYSDGDGVTVGYGDVSVGFDFSMNGYDGNAGDNYALGAAWAGDLADGVSASVAVATDFADFAAGAAVSAAMNGAAFYVNADLAVAAATTYEVVAGGSYEVEGVTVALDGYYNSNNILDMMASTSIPVADLTLDVAGSLTDVLGTLGWSVDGDVAYTYDVYDIALGAGYGSDAKLDLGASVSTGAIVDGATLKLAYATDDIMTDKGAISASCTISL